MHERNRTPLPLPALTFVAVAACAIFFAAPSADACSVPVFRYALERWHPDPYRAVVFTRETLSAADSVQLNRLAASSGAPDFANLDAYVVDIGNAADSLGAALWKSVDSSTTLPCIALFTPRYHAGSSPLWTGPLTAESVGRILHSPVRREIVRRILSGETAVWVMVTGSDRAQAKTILDTLRRSISEVEKGLELPTPDPVAGYFPPSKGVPLKIAFSTMVVSATDPLERILVRMLLGSEVNLDTMSAPQVYPIFGRGRWLVQITPKQMTTRSVRDVCTFLSGPCACTVKAQNPGVDMLFCADWQGALREPMVVDEPLPELTGLSELAGKAVRDSAGVSTKSPVVSSKATGAATNSAETAVATPAVSAVLAIDTIDTAAVRETRVPTELSAPIQFTLSDSVATAPARRSTLARNLLWALSGLLATGAIASAVMFALRRRDT